jgi:L-threonylcarbamoyladenylate synthase
MILYPTETLYALGVNALDPTELAKLFKLKDRDRGKAASWLVRTIGDIEKYAEVPPLAQKIAAHFLPGSLSLVLKAKVSLSNEFVAPDRTIAFRISSDRISQKLIEEFMQEHGAPLTCTSANISGAPTLPVPGEILQQFGPNAHLIRRVIDDGPRKGLASTIVRVEGDAFRVLREGEITEQAIHKALQDS